MNNALCVADKLQYPDFNKEPINSFRLPNFNLCFRGSSSESIEDIPNYYIGFNADFNDDSLIEGYLASHTMEQTLDEPCLYIRLASIDFNVVDKKGGFAGGFFIPINIIRLQNIDGVQDIRDFDQLKKARQVIYEMQSEGIDGMHGPDHIFLEVDKTKYLVENSCMENSAPCYLLFHPIDHRHALMIDVTFEGFVPMGAPFPPELHDACMEVVKDFLSHVELTKAE